MKWKVVQEGPIDKTIFENIVSLKQARTKAKELNARAKIWGRSQRYLAQPERVK